MPEITVISQVYNTKELELRQCIESVLNQTYTGFEYILVDNGCTNGSSEIMREYAQKDARIALVRFEKNVAAGRWIPIAQRTARGEYLTNLDSDDWLEPDFLERLVSIAEETDADIVCTGTLMHTVESGRTSARAAPARMCLERAQFAEAFPYYHAHLRTVWAKLIRTEALRAIDFGALSAAEIGYGLDTLLSFAMLRKSRRLVLDDSILHHYRIHSTSISYQYDPRRFDSDVYLYNDAVDFLSAYGPVSAQNRGFLACVYANAIFDTANVLRKARLTPEEKLRECRRIAGHPLTRDVFRYEFAESVRARKNLTAAVLECGGATDDAAKADYRALLEALAPKCAPALSPETLPLLAEAPDLLEAALADNADALLEGLLEMIRLQKQSKKWDLYGMVCALSAGKPLLKGVGEKKFLRHYGELYLAVWREQYAEALDAMTGVLLGGEKVNEAFLQLYLSLAALLNQADAFVFGKIRLAELALRRRDKEACGALVAELEEMGAGEDERVIALREKMDG